MRLRRWIAGAVTLLTVIVALALVLVDTGWGHRLVAERIGTIRTANGLRFAVGRIDGSLYGATRLRDLRVYDLDGLVFDAPEVALDWAPWRWLRGELAIERLAVPAARLEHVPRTRRTGRRGPILPDFDIRIGDLRVDRLALDGERVLVCDFKTGRPPAADAPLPANEAAQIALYATLLGTIYPDRAIVPMLVWTSGPVLRRLAPEEVAAALAGIGSQAA